jgi:membrane-bound ClpP family serine protease
MNQRPIAIIIIAALLLINGILTLVTGLRFDAHPIVLVLGAAALLLSLGMWQMWSWAWIGTVLLQLTAIGYALYDWFTGGPIDFLAMMMGVLVLYYLLRADTRALFFGSRTKAEENSAEAETPLAGE